MLLCSAMQMRYLYERVALSGMQADPAVLTLEPERIFNDHGLCADEFLARQDLATLLRGWLGVLPHHCDRTVQRHCLSPQAVEGRRRGNAEAGAAGINGAPAVAQI